MRVHCNTRIWEIGTIIIKPITLLMVLVLLTSSLLADTGYTPSPPIHYSGKNNVTISNLSINCDNANNIGMLLQNCSNIHITNCKIYNSLTFGIQLYNCKNITIDNCFITNVKAGVNAIQCITIKVNKNQFLNMNGPYPAGNFVQFDNVNGAGNQINYNRCENIAGVAQHPQDGLSVYKSNGLPGDSIQVIGNWIRGGQVQKDSGGAAGIVLGDVGGSYQVARDNILVNPGFVGIQAQGGDHIKIDHNIIYCAATPFSVVGMGFGNYSGKSTSDITYSYNKIKWITPSGKEQNVWIDPKARYTPDGLSTNIFSADLNESILPAVIITKK
ncbi:right-handed parallel beta-helix repeat-containing protein [Mucilaginibacter sp. McL0603]|uniref:right-handed parallel beta-helix repeat-containing protein n=1 Tax=Mucilaginibacter sp. McL0603 TaxID=3415670 RepID=UPI003CF64D65